MEIPVRGTVEGLLYTDATSASAGGWRSWAADRHEGHERSPCWDFPDFSRVAGGAERGLSKLEPAFESIVRKALALW
jgi:hypothetical protein